MAEQHPEAPRLSAIGTRRRYSMHMNIEGFMRNNRYPRGYDIFQQEDGTELTPSEARAFLEGEKAKGHKVIPCNCECANPCSHADKGCTGFDHSGSGCPGYVISEETPT